MIEFLVKRIATIVPTLMFVSMLIFGLQQLLPGDPGGRPRGEDRNPNVVAYLRQKLHLDEPLPVRYLYWIGGVLHGDLGESPRMQKPVLELIVQKLPVTIELAGAGDDDRARDRHSRRKSSPQSAAAPRTSGANAFALWGLSTPTSGSLS